MCLRIEGEGEGTHVSKQNLEEAIGLSCIKIDNKKFNSLHNGPCPCS